MFLLVEERIVYVRGGARLLRASSNGLLAVQILSAVKYGVTRNGVCWKFQRILIAKHFLKNADIHKGEADLGKQAAKVTLYIYLFDGDKGVHTVLGQQNPGSQHRKPGCSNLMWVRALCHLSWYASSGLEEALG